MENEHFVIKNKKLSNKDSKENILLFRENRNKTCPDRISNFIVFILIISIIFLFVVCFTTHIVLASEETLEEELTENLETEEIVSEEDTSPGEAEEYNISEEDTPSGETNTEIIVDTVELENQLSLLNHISYIQTALLLAILIYLFLHSMLERRKI